MRNNSIQHLEGSGPFEHHSIPSRPDGIESAPLGELAIIRSGYPFRGKIQHDPEGTWGVVQMRDIVAGGGIRRDVLTHVSGIRPKVGHLIGDGDVLIMARGTNNLAAVIKGQMPRTVAANYFMVLRVNQSRVLPEYLSWYINQSTARNYFQRHQLSSTVPIITTETVSGLMLPLPPIVIQRHIVRISQLLNRERHLMEELAKKRAQLLEVLLLNQLR
ncbi:MAG: hypothetical protein JWQ98_369 [Chlorobi bacterium]|nr:hypothetical protein [Chlorobiota bacterium]